MRISVRKNIRGTMLRAAIAAALLSSLLVLAACGSAGEPAATAAPAATESPTAAAAGDNATNAVQPPARLAANFALPSATGDTVSLSSFAGDKNVVLVFYRGFW